MLWCCSRIIGSFIDSFIIHVHSQLIEGARGVGVGGDKKEELTSTGIEPVRLERQQVSNLPR